MYHVESSPNVKLSYLLSPGLLNLFLPKFDIEISSIPKSLGVNIRIQIWYTFIRNSGIVLSKMLKQANLIISRITFWVKKIWSGIRSIINISKVKADYIPSILESGKLLIIPVLLLTFLIISLLMWVKTLTKTFRVGTVVQPLFWRAIFLTQCFSSLLPQLKLIHTYLKWTITNPLVPVVFQSHC